MTPRATSEPFREEVRRLLDESGLTFRDLAEQAGVSEPYLAQVLTGKRPPSPGLVVKVALALDLPEDYFREYRAELVIHHVRSDPELVDRFYNEIKKKKRPTA
jgi:transcriptional regulator with XRE-family HTH domain